MKRLKRIAEYVKIYNTYAILKNSMLYRCEHIDMNMQKIKIRIKEEKQ